MYRLSFVGAIALAAAWTAGCSSSPPEAPAEDDETPTFEGRGSAPRSNTGSDGGTASARKTPAPGPSDGGWTMQACIDACEAKYPVAAKLAAAIDTCWADNCAECMNMGAGPIVGPGGGCQQPIWTPSEACSRCTAQSCCAEWDGCFGKAECGELAACADTCHVMGR